MIIRRLLDIPGSFDKVRGAFGEEIHRCLWMSTGREGLEQDIVWSTARYRTMNKCHPQRQTRPRPANPAHALDASPGSPPHLLRRMQTCLLTLQDDLKFRLSCEYNRPIPHRLSRWRALPKAGEHIHSMRGQRQIS